MKKIAERTKDILSHPYAAPLSTPLRWIAAPIVVAGRGYHHLGQKLLGVSEELSPLEKLPTGIGVIVGGWSALGGAAKIGAAAFALASGAMPVAAAYGVAVMAGFWGGAAAGVAGFAAGHLGTSVVGTALGTAAAAILSPALFVSGCVEAFNHKRAQRKPHAFNGYAFHGSARQLGRFQMAQAQIASLYAPYCNGKNLVPDDVHMRADYVAQGVMRKASYVTIRNTADGKSVESPFLRHFNKISGRPPEVVALGWRQAKEPPPYKVVILG
ncbi:MAG: hypothetical protein OXT65_12885 [Alphaproteobacteria bacterium]|nr:hypothetical protein [Alphaproteobacteria bacterium]